MNIKKIAFIKRWYILLFLMFLLFVFTYWFKVQVGINLFDSVSIGSHFPFKYLINHIIKSPEPGIILEENFNKKRIFKIWSKLWMREHGTVTKELSSGGFNGSTCLLIKNTGKGSWAYGHNKRVEVTKGDIFYFGGLVFIEGDNLFASFSVAAFDENQNVIGWNLFKKKVNKTGAWIRVENRFNIPDDKIKYIAFRLTGVGHGDYRFDNIIFRKIK